MIAGMVIIGAGEAGTQAALTLRENGWTGPISLISAEGELPYERPPLSKQVLSDEGAPTATRILTHDAIEAHDIKFHQGSRVTDVDRLSRQVRLADGRCINYQKLLLATGSNPRRLNVAGVAPDKVLYLRNFRDALAIRSRLSAGKEVVVIGGGFIGLEVAASARGQGLKVTVLEVAPRLLTRGVPPAIAQAIADRHHVAGVKLEYGINVTAITSCDDRHSVILSDGRQIDCDCIIAGVGATPETSIAEKCGLEVDNGIKTNHHLGTSDPEIFAAGDCCSFPHDLYGGRRIRLEAWRNARNQGACAARNMLGAEERYEVVPWFWSDQYDLTIQIAGLPDEGCEHVIRNMGDSSLHFHFGGDRRLVAASGLGRVSKIAKEVRIAEMLISRKQSLDPAAVADPDFKLRSLLV
jgi:3-phenylpropionate/trans-cinnamate dioxygenase ferredoxin reductase subunit